MYILYTNTKVSGQIFDTVAILFNRSLIHHFGQAIVSLLFRTLWKHSSVETTVLVHRFLILEYSFKVLYIRGYPPMKVLPAVFIIFHFVNLFHFIYTYFKQRIHVHEYIGIMKIILYHILYDLIIEFSSCPCN